MPVSIASADAHRAPQVAREDVRDEPVLRVVGRGDRVGLVGERRHRRDRPEDLVAEDRPSRARRGRAPSAGRTSPGRRAGRRRSAPARPARARRRRAPRSWPTAASLIIGPSSAPGLGARRRCARRAIASASRAVKALGDATRGRGSGSRPCRPRPPLRSLATQRAGDRGVDVRVLEHEERARCRRAPSTRSRRVRAARASSWRPTSVEPVNESLRTRGSSTIGGHDLARPRGR